jgi:hypothetical protein
MIFFLTSVGTGDGADLGGLEGADNHCLILAEAVGAVNQTWRAYLSTQTTGEQPAVNARDRIGEGPWHNANGLLIANNVDQLHYDNSNLNYDDALNERGERMNSGAMGDSPNQHDILTGTQMDGTAFGRGEDRTCDNWTSKQLRVCDSWSPRSLHTHDARRVLKLRPTPHADVASPTWRRPVGQVCSTASP